MATLREKGKSDLGDFNVSVSDEFFLLNDFGMANVNTKTFILMLAQYDPLSFISGAPIDLSKTLKESNRTEFHHLMPKDFLKASGQAKNVDSILANYCFLSRSDNRQLGGLASSKYKKQMAGNVDDILSHALCPKELFRDEFAGFVQMREVMLVEAAAKLCGLEEL